MPSAAAIRTAVSKVDEIWTNPPARNGKYGNCLKSITVESVRGLACTVEFAWPVTVIGGVNGCGKTTILQLCSGAYAKTPEGGRYFGVGEWIRTGLATETPAIGIPASVSFAFWDNTPTLKVPYLADRTRWGYLRRGNPCRPVEFLGISDFYPRIERRDRVHAFQARLHVADSEPLDARVLESISTILGIPYTAGAFNTVCPPNDDWSDHLPEMSRAGLTYSESHMGAGEQKVVRLVRRLESLPERCLILLEEPEVTLHPDAQRGLAWYLMILSRRKGHQIIVATHSTELFETLPAPARVLLHRTQSRVEVVHRAPYLRAARELASGLRANKHLIFVEDDVGRRLVREVLRREARDLFRDAAVISIGNTDDVHRLVTTLRQQGVRAIGVRDPDKGDDPAGGLLSLPGGSAPEVSLLTPENIQRAENYLHGIGSAVERATPHGLGYEGSERAKRVMSALLAGADGDEEQVIDRLVLAWIDGHAELVKALAQRMAGILEADQAARAVS